MDIHNSITDIQQGMRIIKEVGEPHQYKVIDMLIGLTYHGSEIGEEIKAQKIIDNMNEEYILNTANVLWKDKFEEIPRYLKEW